MTQEQTIARSSEPVLRVSQPGKRYSDDGPAALIDVTFDDPVAMLEVTVKYRPAGSPDSRVVKFQRTGQ